MYSGDEVYGDDITSGPDEYVEAGILPRLSDEDLEQIHQVVTESTMIANRLSIKQRGLEQEHNDTRGDHYGVVQTDCTICFPVAMTEMQREDLRDEIEMDLL